MFNLLSSSSSNQKLFVSRSMHICIFLYMYCRLLFYSFILFISFIFCVNLVSIVRFFLNQNITYPHTKFIMQKYILHSVRLCIPNDCDSRISRSLHQIVNNTDVIRLLPSTIQKYSTKNWCIFDQLLVLNYVHDYLHKTIAKNVQVIYLNSFKSDIARN